MTLPESIMKAALLGTANEAFSLDFVTQSQLFSPIQETPPEAQLLLWVASAKLRDQVGYVAERHPLSLRAQCHPDVTVYCGPKSMRQLRLMLTGIHRFALREWLILAHRAGQHVSEEVLPHLLLLGQKRQDLRPYLLPVIGQHGYWLSGEITNQNWNWVLETPEDDIDDVITVERLQEDVLIKNLKDREIKEALRDLGRYPLIWSRQLVDAFLNRLERTTASRWSAVSADLAATIIPLAYGFPMSMREAILGRIGWIPALSADYQLEVRESMDVILDFRDEMLTAINKRED